MATNGRRGEFALIDFIRRRASASKAVILGIGDDCAILDGSDGPLVITTDLIVEGVHFEKAVPLRQVGWKAAAVSFSDVAAMGLRPEALLCAAALPEGFSMRQAEELLLGINDACAACGVAMAGGDTTSSSGPLTLCTTVTGRGHGLRPVRRSGAKVGDAIAVTGSLGGSILGRHLSFRPRIEEGAALNAQFGVHAMIDVSDGLSADLNHILEESGVGAVIEADAVPVSDAARELSRRSGQTPLHHALADGEDFELVFTLDPRDAARLAGHPLSGAPVTIIGTVIESGLFLARGGMREPLRPEGYEHFRGPRCTPS